jgi:pyrroline-5-carboxylate reductase
VAYTESVSGSKIAFIGGGNMAGAIVGGLLRAGRPAPSIVVVEPQPGAREALSSRFGIAVLEAADATLDAAATVVWAVKPQSFREAAAPCRAHVGQALQLSIMAGIRSDAIVAATGSEAVVRSMPNTAALIGQGIAGVYARQGVSAAQRTEAEAVLAPTGRMLWVGREDDLDAVTALSGSGPAYVFYFVEAMIQAAVEMGLSAAQGRELALATFAGATALAQRTAEPPELLRERVTSKGGTTQAAITSLDSDGVKAAFVRALHTARARAQQLGAEFS